MRNWIIVVALLTAPAPAFAQNVNVDSDPSAAFARYRTYSWTAGTANRLAENRIRAAVESQLNTAKMNKAIAKMFEQYPPTQK